MIKKIGIAVMLCISFVYVQGQSQSSPQNTNNNEWSQLNASIWGIADRDSASKAWGSSSVKYKTWKELRNRQYRGSGIEYFNKYPDDARFNEWFLKTIGENNPLYWKDAMTSAENENSYLEKGTPFTPVIDMEARKQWNIQYLAYRARYLNDERVTNDQTKEFKRNEFGREIGQLNRDISLSTGDLGRKLSAATPLLMRYAEDAMDQNILNWLLDIASHDENLHTGILSALKMSKDSTTRKNALEEESLYTRMRQKPVQLKLPVLGDPNKIIDIEKMRGKVVMIDFWNIHCASCIAHMPKFERIYQQFKDQGFELISVCVIGYDCRGNEAKERAKAMEIEKKFHLTYPSLELFPGYDSTGKLLNESDPVWKYFGYPAGGAVFLLDKDGHLVTTDLTGQWQEYEIRRLLGLDVNKTGLKE